LRADARRNRERLLVVADEVFAARGIGASTEDVARAAGVGIGTVFRHFPTKESLLAAVLVLRLQHMTERADRLSSSSDPGAAFASFFREIVDDARTKLTLSEALASAGVDLTRSAADTKNAFNAALERLLSRAQQAGAVRTDVGLPELLALIVGASRAAQQLGDPALQQRTVQILLDGLAAPGNPLGRPGRPD
jgi:AcrR family transcriptional regulator